MTSSESVGVAMADDGFADFYRREVVRAVRLAHLLTGSNDAAEDVAHEAFLRIRDRLPEIANPAGYLTTSVVNLCRNWHRGRGRARARELLVARDVVASAASPHDELLDVVDRLPFRQRTVLVARYWLDLPEVEIAALVGCRPGTVKSLASRGLEALRKELS